MSGVFLGSSDLEATGQRAHNGEQPWAAAYEQLMAAADESLKQEPLSVRQNGGSPSFRWSVARVSCSSILYKSAILSTIVLVLHRIGEQE